jgi:hypothetical protein
MENKRMLRLTCLLFAGMIFFSTNNSTAVRPIVPAAGYLSADGTEPPPSPPDEDPPAYTGAYFVLNG